MIGDPPVLTLRRRFERPSDAQIAALNGTPTGFVVDAQNGQGALHHSIKPLWPEARFVGSAVTAKCGPRDNMAVYVAIRIARPGDVLVLQTNAYEDAAVIGDNVAAIAKQHGVVAVVTDGLVRDIEGLLDVGLPVFCRGLTPNSPYKHGPIEVGTPIAIGGMPVRAGDLLLGDRDGVVVVERERIDLVIRSLDAVREQEAATQRKIAAGFELPGWIDELIESERTVRLD
ncbi:MAG TPA: RraA family protein [Geminicoccaceae bacterium]